MGRSVTGPFRRKEGGFGAHPLGRVYRGYARNPATLGPDKYDDPREVMFYKLNQEAGDRELEGEYEKERSAQQYKDVEGLGFGIFILIVVDFFIPSWVLGPWF